VVVISGAFCGDDWGALTPCGDGGMGAIAAEDCGAFWVGAVAVFVEDEFAVAAGGVCGDCATGIARALATKNGANSGIAQAMLSAKTS